MGIATCQWRASVGSWNARFKFWLTRADTNGISSFSTIFYALVIAMLLVVSGVELNPGPSTQSCCELCGINLDMMKKRELALNQREEAVFVMLQRREAAFDIREHCLEQREALLQSREAAVRRRENLVAEKEKAPPANRERGEIDVVRELLEEEMISKTGLLVWAVLNSRMSIARFLIEEMKVNVNAKDTSGRSVLFLAVENGLLAAVEFLLPLSREDVVDSTGKLAIHSAINKGHTDVVKFLISDSPAVAKRKDKDGCTSLLLAAERGHLDILRFLIQEGYSDVEERQNEGWTALHCAAIYKHLDVVKFIVQEAHFDVNAKDNEGFTALHAASYWSHISVAQFLVEEARADVRIKSLNGATALHLSQCIEINNILTKRS